MQAILQHSFLREEHHILSVGARFNFFRITAEAAIVDGRVNDSMEAYQRLMALWEASPHYIRMDQQRYRADLINYLNVCFRTKRIDLMEMIFRKIRAIEPASTDEAIKVFQDVTHVELVFCLQQGFLERGRRLIE